MAIGFNVGEKCGNKNANIIPQTFTNAICYGQTGSGKTTGFILPNINERMRAGQGMLIYTYKENFDAMIKALALKNNRLDGVIEIGTPWGQGINLLKECSQAELKTWFDSMSNERSYWKTSSFSLLGSVIRALNVLCELSIKNKVNDYKEEVSLAKVADYCDVKSLEKLHYDVLQWLKIINAQKYLFESEEKFFSLDEDATNSLAESRKEKMLEELKYSGYDDCFDNDDKPRINADFFILDELVEAYNGLENYSELENTDGGCGNRAVMETLENYISYAKTLASLNKAEISMDEIVNSNKIVLVNVGIMGENLARLFNICFTNKLITRLRSTSELVPWTIFIDEAHKIITKETMPETSVCRESSFEYIMCVQNKYLLAKALGLRTNEELAIITQNIAYQLSFYDPTNVLCSELNTHEFVHLEDSKLAKIKGKSEPIFIQKNELIEALKLFNQKANIADRVLFNASLENSSYVKALNAKEAVIYYNDGSKVETKIMLKSKVNAAKERANDIINKKKGKKI